MDKKILVRKTIKFGLLASIIILWVFLNATIMESNGGHPNMILNIAVLAAIVAIWKYNPTKETASAGDPPKLNKD